MRHCQPEWQFLLVLFSLSLIWFFAVPGQNEGKVQGAYFLWEERLRGSGVASAGQFVHVLCVNMEVKDRESIRWLDCGVWEGQQKRGNHPK